VFSIARLFDRSKRFHAKPRKETPPPISNQEERNRLKRETEVKPQIYPVFYQTK
jgi:hypothetical protein